MSGNGKKAAPAEEGGGESAPLWIISFADMISLLMAFFVMLSTFNSFDAEETHKLEQAVDSSMMAMGGWLEQESGNSFVPNTGDAGEAQGSSVPTGDQPSESRPMQRTESMDFNKYKVFDVPSAEMFISTTAVLSGKGRQWLDVMAQYLQKMPGGIVIAEQAPQRDPGDSVARALSVMNYLNNKGVGNGRLNISCRGMLGESQYRQEPMLEVCILEQEVKL